MCVLLAAAMMWYHLLHILLYTEATPHTLPCDPQEASLANRARSYLGLTPRLDTGARLPDSQRRPIRTSTWRARILCPAPLLRYVPARGLTRCDLCFSFQACSRSSCHSLSCQTYQRARQEDESLVTAKRPRITLWLQYKDTNTASTAALRIPGLTSRST
jgi:hypothetical protein